jgi:hypothetical protein
MLIWILFVASDCSNVAHEEVLEIAEEVMVKLEKQNAKKYCEAPLAFRRMPPARPYSLLSGFRFQAGEFRLVRIGANERLQS